MLKKDGGALSSSTMAPDEVQSPEQIQASFRSDAPEATRGAERLLVPSEVVICPSEPTTLRLPEEVAPPEALKMAQKQNHTKSPEPERKAVGDVPDAKTPEGVTTKHPPRRQVKGRRLSAKNEYTRLSIKDEMRKSILNDQRPVSMNEKGNLEPKPDEGGSPPPVPIPLPEVAAEDFPMAKYAKSWAPAALGPVTTPQESKESVSSGSFLPWALKSLNEGQATGICNTVSLDELAGFELRVFCPTCKGYCPDHVRCRQRAEQAAFRRRVDGPTHYEIKGWEDRANQPNLGTWMVWMVHRVYLNDPSLESLDFGCFHVPRGDLDPRILPKLFKALASNTHLKQLMLGNTGLESDKGCINQLADALRSNSTLQKLDLQANFLEMCDLTVIFEALSENTGLQDLKVNFQACAKQSFKDSMLEQGNDVYKAAAAAFRTNRSLIKLDLILLQRHWQDQICRGLMQNRQELRKSDIVQRAGG